MKAPKLSVKRYKHSDTSRFVVDGLRINGKRVRRFLATRQEADTLVADDQLHDGQASLSGVAGSHA
jgi:hypothetical protein